jgi:hypothetical protein
MNTTNATPDTEQPTSAQIASGKLLRVAIDLMFGEVETLIADVRKHLDEPPTSIEQARAWGAALVRLSIATAAFAQVSERYSAILLRRFGFAGLVAALDDGTAYKAELLKRIDIALTAAEAEHGPAIDEARA